MLNIHICHRCPFRQATCNGPCACTVTGKDIIEQSVMGCPEGKFTAADQKPEQAIQKPLGLTKRKDCGCSRAKRLTS